tara:strand:+ start:240 stop:782 length:543 start_codon:yes stop_codon:yes gene_type:complete
VPDLVSSLNRILRLLTHTVRHPLLPYPLFLCGTYFFPQVNIELIVRINKSFIFYSWRDDEFGNYGWHLPGGIIRPNETLQTRLVHVFKDEVSISTNLDSHLFQYLGFSEVLNPSLPCVRSHFLSHIYLLDICVPHIYAPVMQDNYCIIDHVPELLISNHLRYVNLIQKCLSNASIIPSQY